MASKELGMNYTLIYQTETDGETVLETLSVEEIQKRIENFKLTRWDYAIVRGEILKTFDQQISLKVLK